MDRMLASVKTARAKQRLEEYEINKMSDLNSRDFTGATDAVVERILKEAAADWDLKEKLQAQADQFYEYQKQQQERQLSPLNPESNDSLLSNSRIELPQDDVNLDDWALERLEEMLDSSQNREDDNGSIADILEDNIQYLRNMIEKESKKGSTEP